MEALSADAAQRLNKLALALASSEREMRGRAMQDLLLWARADAAIRPHLLSIFEDYAATDNDPWTATSAVLGIKLVRGAEAAAQPWRLLLHHANDQMSARAAMMLDEPMYAPLLIEILSTGAPPMTRNCAIRSLGLMRDPAGLPLLLAALQDPVTRPHAILALTEQSDPSVIEKLRPYLSDNTEAWPEDNHGPMLYVHNLAADAIRRLEYIRAHPEAIGSKRLPNHFPVRAAPRRQLFPGTPLLTQLIQLWQSMIGSPNRPAPRPTTGTGAAVSSIGQTAAGLGSPRRRDEPANLFAYTPLIAVAVEIPWIVATIIGYVVFTGGKTNNPNAIPLFDFIAMSPALLGLVLGIGGVSRRRPRLRVEWICFVLGCVLCALFVLSFGYEMSTHVPR